MQTSSHQLSWLSFTKYSPCTYLWGMLVWQAGAETNLTYISHTILPVSWNNTYIFLFFQIINSHRRKVNFLQVTQLARDRARLQIRCHSQAQPFLLQYASLRSQNPQNLSTGKFTSTDMRGIWVSSILYQPHSGCADINVYLCQVL